MDFKTSQSFFAPFYNGNSKNFLGKHLAVMTEDSIVYVANQEGFTSALKRHLIHDGHLIDVVLSQAADYEIMDDENKIGDLIGISESSVYIWDPLQGGEPVGLRFEEITNDKISSVVSMSNELCIIGTTSGLAFTPYTSNTPLQVFGNNQGIFKIIGMNLSKRLLMATQSGEVSLVKIKENFQLVLEENLPKVQSHLTDVLISQCETFIVSFSDQNNDVIVWTKTMPENKYDSTCILPHPCHVNCIDMNPKISMIASGTFGNSNF